MDSRVVVGGADVVVAATVVDVVAIVGGAVEVEEEVEVDVLVRTVEVGAGTDVATCPDDPSSEQPTAPSVRAPARTTAATRMGATVGPT